MPAIFFGGSCDSMPINTDAVNEWINLSGAIIQEPDGDQASADEVERFTGLRTRNSEIRRYDGQNYYIGSYFNNDGVSTFRTVSVEGAPHWLMPSEAAVVWKFFSQFARNTDSGEIVYLK